MTSPGATSDTSLPVEPVPASRRTVLIALALYLAVAVVVLAGVPMVQDLTLSPRLREAADFTAADILKLYVLLPVVTFATCAFFMAPGLILAATYGHGKHAAYWLLAAFCWSVLALVGTTTVAQIAAGYVLRGPSFWLTVLVTGLAALALMTRRLARGETLRLRLDGDRRDLAFGVALFFALLLVFLPKFYWESFSADGIDALKGGRLFANDLWPFWTPETGFKARPPSLSTFLVVVPNSWFIRLWGDLEFAVRAPLLLYATMVYVVLFALIRTGRSVVIGLADYVLVAGIVGVTVLSLGYSGGIDPYFGDLALPATREMIAMALLLGYLLAYLEDRLYMMLGTGLMAGFVSSTGGLWLAIVAIAGWLAWQPRDRRRTNATIVVLVAAVIITIILPRAIGYFDLYRPGDGEFSPTRVADRLRFVSFTDWQKFLYLIVPCGIVPAFALLAWRQQDVPARVMTLVTAAFFVFFYLQAYKVTLHLFAPIMLTSVVVFWRLPALQGARGPLLRGAAAVGLLAAAWLAWPRDFGIHDFDRLLGAKIEVSGPEFEIAERDPGDIYRGFSPRTFRLASDLLGPIFPTAYTEQELSERLVAAPLVLWYYAEWPKQPDQKIQYRVKPVASATPADGTLLRETDGYGLFVTDMAEHERLRTTARPSDGRAAIFDTERSRIFGRGAMPGDRLVFDLLDPFGLNEKD